MSEKPGLLLSTFTHIYLSRKHSLPTCLSKSACCTAGIMLIPCFTWHSFTQTCYFTLFQIAERVCVLSFYMGDLLICLGFLAFLSKKLQGAWTFWFIRHPGPLYMDSLEEYSIKNFGNSCGRNFANKSRSC